MSGKTCKCPAYDFPHREGSGKCGMDCHHPIVDVSYSLYVQATLYEPAEYVAWGICSQCGERMDYEDIPEWSEKVDV